jgi:indolepyruvate ferredoxin oxidoreductase beta subunit
MVRTAETIGMAQRGGSVLGHVRIAPQETATAPGSTVLSPLVPIGHADLLIGFEPAEAVRALDYLRPGGMVVVTKQALEPVTATLSNLVYDGTAELDYLRVCERSGRLATLAVVDGAAICTELGSTRVLNVVLLGAALGLEGPDLPAAALIAAIESLVKPQYIELNKTALTRGMELGQERGRLDAAL